MNSTENHNNHKSKKRSILGLVFITIGSALIAKKMNILPDNVTDVLISWQMLLIAIGAFNIFINKKLSTGLILISLGVFFILPKMFVIPFDVKEMFWPAIFVVIGVIMITVRNRHKTGEGKSSEHHIDMLTIFGGGNRKITSEQFLGGKVTSIFGGSDIDLTGAKLRDSECVVDVFTMFGGAEIAVPRGWEVQVDVTSIFGGFDDKRGPVETSLDSSKKVLIIKGFTIFGGGEVKSY